MATTTAAVQGMAHSLQEGLQPIASTSGRDDQPQGYHTRSIPPTLLQRQPSVRKAKHGVQALAQHVPDAFVHTVRAAESAVKPAWRPGTEKSKLGQQQQGLGHPASASWGAGSLGLLASIAADLSASASGKRNAAPELPWSWGQLQRQRAAPDSAQARDTLLRRGSLVLDLGRPADEAPRLLGARSVDAW